MGSYVQQQRGHAIGDSESENGPRPMYPSETQSSYYGYQQSSTENFSKTALDSGTDANGLQYRTSDIGRVTPQWEILNRIVPFWEMFISSVALFGYHIVSLAIQNIGGKKALSVLFLNGCQSEFQQPNVDICATSILTWSLIGGAVLYFFLTSILSVLLYAECHRHGYPGMFTALWNSPFFLVCYFFREKNRIDLLTIPNKFLGFRTWTRLNLHRFALAVYSLITTLLVVYYLTRYTVDNDDLIAQKEYKSGNSFYRVYNPYFLPYYAAIYFYCKTIISSGIDIRNSYNTDKSELVGVHYTSLKCANPSHFSSALIGYFSETTDFSHFYIQMSEEASYELSSISDPSDFPQVGLKHLDSLPRCPICKDFFKTPMIAECGHAYCSLCIRRCLAAEQ
ncbi:4851_t:CDS:2, partial [Acaulospora morrowiae]